MSLTPKNWKNFQHYKDRAPAWIKLHRGLLDDYAFVRLPLASQALAPRLWLLASEYKDGCITASLDEIAFRVHASIDDVRAAVKPLVDAGFFIDDGDALADCKQRACLEESREEEQVETEEEEISSLRSDDHIEVSRATSIPDDWPKDYRDQFWSKYPRKVARKSAFKALDKIRKSREVSFSRLMAGIEKIPIGEPVFIPHPATWLNAGRWDDEQYEPIGGFNGKPKRSVQDAAADLVGRMREFDRPPPGGIRSGEGGSVVGLLSKG